MGRLGLIVRLAERDMRRHVGPTVLLLVAIASATTVFTMALALHGVVNRPYQRTKSETKGPDVVAYLQSPKQARAFIHAAGVTAYSGPFPIVSSVVRVNRLTAGVVAEGRSRSTTAAVDQPKLTAGGWVRPGGVVVERTFAEALRLNVGTKLTLDDHQFTVVGIAVTAAQPPYPNLCYFTANACANINFIGFGARKLGLMWLTERDTRRLATATNPLSDYALNLKLRNPAQAPAFVDHQPLQIDSGARRRWATWLSTWEGIAQADALLIADEQSVLEPGAVLLGLLALASVAVLVGARLAESTRRVGLLKAVGGSPKLVAATFLVENLSLALAGGGIGLGIGWLVAPLIANPGGGLVGTAGAPALTFAEAALVLGTAFAVALLATLIPAIRAARTSTVRALDDAVRPPRRRGLLVRASRKLPVSALFGLRLVARRPRRALLSTACIAVTVTGVVALLSFRSAVNTDLGNPRAFEAFAVGLGNPVLSRDQQMLLVITITLVALSALTAIFTAWATVLDSRHASAVMVALGTRARQVSSGLAWAQVFSALPGAIAGIPLGILLFRAASGKSSIPPASWLVGTVLATLIVCALLTMVAARIGGRSPVVEALQSE
jgi:putative ABC transport system permease protein